MKVVAALVCALAAVTATPLFGTEQCANGPAVWCVNIQTAKQCSAVTHCQQTVWNKPVLNSAKCEICKEIITVLGNFLKDNDTQAETLALLNKICDLLEEPSLISQCKQIVADYYPLVLNIVEQELSDPSVACCALGACKSLQQYLASLKPVQLTSNEIPDVDLSKMSPFMANIPILKPQEKTDLPAENKDLCQDCLQLVSDFQDALKTNSSFSKMLIENYLKECDQLGGGISEVCKTYINQYGDLAIQMLIQMPARELCCTAGLCEKKEPSPLQNLIPAKVIVPAMKLQPAVNVPELKSSSALPECEICELVVEKLEEFLDSNTTRVHIEEGLEKVCDILPSKYRSECKSFVKKYCDAIISFMEAEGNPKLLCMVMGLCPSREPKIVKLDSPKFKSESCELCKMVMSYLDSLLGKNATQQEIEQELKKICNYLSKSVFDECCTLVDTYGPLIIDLVLQKLDPGTACAAMNLCPGVQKPLLGTEKCMWGPSYWCKDLETAGSCNAIEHCKRHVWN